MMAMAVQVNGTLTRGPSSFVSKNLSPLPSKTSLLSVKPKASFPHSSISARTQMLLSVAAELATAETSIDEISDTAVVNTPIVEEPQKVKVGVKSMAKPKLVLKFIWMEKNIGLGLDQEIPGHGTVPLSPYSFWPRKDAWEDLKTAMENKPWISQKKMIILLNQATDIINLWQQSGGNLS